MKTKLVKLTLIILIISGCQFKEDRAPGTALSDSDKKGPSDFRPPRSCGDNYGSPDFSCDCSHVNADLPFHYSLTSDRLLLLTDGGPLHGVVSPWGAHTEPFTGHFNGNHKADWGALYAASFDEMTELTPSNQNGICEQGETCGVLRSKVASRQLKYIAPDNRFMITGVFYSKGKNRPNEFQGEMGYQVEGWLCHYRYTMPYMRGLSQVLREKMIAAGYEDPHSKTEDGFGNPQSNSFNPDNLIKGAPIILDKGDEIGLLEIRAEAVPGYPDYYRGWGGTGHVPYSALEFTMSNLALMKGYDTGLYPLLPKRTQDALLDVFYAEVKKGRNSIKFGPHMHNEWLWKAEMVLNASEPERYQDYSSIFTWTGGWLETPNTANCKGWVDTWCDESFTIFKIHKNTPFYEPRFYDSQNVNYLVHYRKAAEGVMVGEVLSPSEPNPIQGVLVIKWRSVSNQYQKIAYRVEPENKQIKIRLSTRSFRTTNEIEDPAIPVSSEPCDSENVVCLNHKPNF